SGGEFATLRVAVGELATFRNPEISQDFGRRKGESATSPLYRHRAPLLLGKAGPGTGYRAGLASWPRRLRRSAHRTSARGSWPGPPWPAERGPACPCRTSGCATGP